MGKEVIKVKSDLIVQISLLNPCLGVLLVINRGSGVEMILSLEKWSLAIQELIFKEALSKLKFISYH